MNTIKRVSFFLILIIGIGLFLFIKSMNDKKKQMAQKKAIIEYVFMNYQNDFLRQNDRLHIAACEVGVKNNMKFNFDFGGVKYYFSNNPKNRIQTYDGYMMFFFLSEKRLEYFSIWEVAVDVNCGTFQTVYYKFFLVSDDRINLLDFKVIENRMINYHMDDNGNEIAIENHEIAGRSDLFKPIMIIDKELKGNK